METAREHPSRHALYLSTGSMLTLVFTSACKWLLLHKLNISNNERSTDISLLLDGKYTTHHAVTMILTVIPSLYVLTEY